MSQQQSKAAPTDKEEGGHRSDERKEEEEKGGTVAPAAAARVAAYDDAALKRRTRQAPPRRGARAAAGPLDPKLQRMLDAFAAEQAASAAAAAARAERVGLPSSSHAALASTHRQVVVDGRLTYRTLTERERMQRQLAAHVGGAHYEKDEEEMKQEAAATSNFSAAAMKLLIDSTAPAAHAATARSAGIVSPVSAAPSSTHPSAVQARVQLDVSSEGAVAIAILVEPAALPPAPSAAAASSAATVAEPAVEARVQLDVALDGSIVTRVVTSLVPSLSLPLEADDGSFRAFVDVEVTALGQVQTRIELVSVAQLRRMLRQQQSGTHSDAADDMDEEQSLVDLMDADSDLQMHGGSGQVRTLDDYRSAVAAPARPPPSLHDLVLHYVNEQLDSNPIGGLLYLCSFDWPSPDHTMQWMALLPRIAALYRERRAVADAQREAEAKARGNVHGISLASNVGRFHRSSASSSVRAASSATLPRNVVTLDQYDVDLRARGGGLPADWVPRGLDDIWHASARYGVEEVMTLLQALGQQDDEVEVTRCYVLVMQQLQEEQQAQQRAVQGAAAAPTSAAGAAAAPSSSPTSPAISRTSSSASSAARRSSGGSGNIATLSSLRSGSSFSATAVPSTSSPPKPALRSWGSGHSLLPSTPAGTSAATATASSPAGSAAAAFPLAASGGAGSAASASAPAGPTAAPHPDVQSLFHVDGSAPSTKLQLLLLGTPAPLVLSLNVSRTLADVRRAVAAASGFDDADSFELVIPRPRQILTRQDDIKTIQQLRLQNAKIQQIAK